LATAAQTVSDGYRGVDAFARARVSDVERALRTAAEPDSTLEGDA
jgi:hypothetical protein